MDDKVFKRPAMSATINNVVYTPLRDKIILECIFDAPVMLITKSTNMHELNHNASTTKASVKVTESKVIGYGDETHSLELNDLILLDFSAQTNWLDSDINNGIYNNIVKKIDLEQEDCKARHIAYDMSKHEKITQYYIVPFYAVTCIKR